MQAFIADLESVSPGVRVIEDIAARQAHARDRWPVAAKWSEDELASRLPAAVVTPTSTDEVADVVRLAAKHGHAVVPYGGGSGVVGGVINRGEFISLDLGGLAGAPQFDDERGEVTVPAGVIAADLQRMLNQRGRRLPHYPQSEPVATIGGFVATRSAGTFSSKYGNIEDFVVGLEVVLADGSVIQTKVSPRSSTGPNIAQLFIGSEGTLGVITAVTLRTLALAERSEFRGVACPSIGDGIAIVRRLIDSGITPAVIRLYDPAEAEHLYVESELEPGRALLILGFDGYPMVVQAELDAALALAAGLGGEDLGSTPGKIWEKTRYDASWIDRGNAGEFSYADAIEVAVSWPAFVPVYTEVLAALAPHVDNAYGHFSHFYPDGGAIYFILFTSGTDAESALARYEASWNAVLELVTRHGGSISHHHGVGEARKGWMRTEHGESLKVLAALKQALDPNGVLAPGKLGLSTREEVAR